MGEGIGLEGRRIILKIYIHSREIASEMSKVIELW